MVRRLAYEGAGQGVTATRKVHCMHVGEELCKKGCRVCKVREIRGLEIEKEWVRKQVGVRGGEDREVDCFGQLRGERRFDDYGLYPMVSHEFCGGTQRGKWARNAYVLGSEALNIGEG